MLDLGGPWQFFTDPDGRLSLDDLDEAQGWRTIHVPSTWQAQFPDLLDYAGVAWYRRTFTAPAAWRGAVVRLRFGAVNYYAEAWLNGNQVGRHEGGYTPFAFDITPQVRLMAENTLVVRVTYPTAGGAPPDDRERFLDFPFDEIPSGKQGHYCRASGIWQRVWVEARPHPFVALAHVTPDIDRGQARVRVRLEWASGGQTSAMALRAVRRLRVRALNAAGEVVSQAAMPLGPPDSEYDVTLRIANAHLWEPDAPYLYTLEVSPMAGDAPTETVRDTFGMRKIEARDHRIYLNNHPIFLAGALDQAFYPRTIYAEPSDAELEDQFRQAKHLGLNFLRAHIKLPDPRYCAAADRVGLLLWIDMPNFWRSTPPAQARLTETMRAAIARDFNHPSIFAWCLINEEWGVVFDHQTQRQWLKGLWRQAKQLDPTRLIIDNSPAGGGHLISDVEDQHVYMAMPEKRRDFARWCDEFAAHPAYTFRWPESERRGFEPLLVSEFGNWGLPEIEPLLRFYGGADPYWFNQEGYGGPIRAGVERFKEWHLDGVFGSFDAMARDMQWHQCAALKTQIEIMRRHPEIVGYVITQFTDLNSESNGLLDMTRRPKQYYDALAAVQAQDALLPVWERCAFWGGEEISLPVRVSHFSTRKIKGATLRWQVIGDDPHGEVRGINVAPAAAPEVGVIRFIAPDSRQPRQVHLRLELVAPDGGRIAQTTFDFAVIPSAARRAPAGSRPTGRLSVAVQADDKLSGMAERLRDAGAAVDDDAKVEVAVALDQALAQRLANGARVLLLASPTANDAAAFAGLRIEDRGARGWWGDWMSNVNWQRSGLCPHLPPGALLGMAYESVTPKAVISSVEPTQAADILAGIFVGWTHDPAALTAQFRAGEGVLLATTFDLAGGYGSDPIATAMLHDLLDYLRTGRAAPVAALDVSAIARVRVVLPTAQQGQHAWRFTVAAPPAGWERPDFDDRGWQQGPAGFGAEGTPNTTVRTLWNTADIWARAEFSLDAAPRQALLRLYHDEDAEFYLNGEKILTRKGFVATYQAWELPPEALKSLRAGRNVLAVHCHQSSGGQYVDAGLSVVD